MSSTESKLIVWREKAEWKHEGKHFCVVVSRHENEWARKESAGCYDSDGGYRWNVYAYIYPKHPMFPHFAEDEPMYRQPWLPFHAGISYFVPHYRSQADADARHNGQRICSFQAGSDYNHLYDNPFTQMATKEDAYEVFYDAERLIAYLTMDTYNPKEESDDD